MHILQSYEKVENIMAQAWTIRRKDARLIFADGTIFEGYGLGAQGHVCAEICFNTALTGYQEILTDLSYAGQIITFTFPHIGNVGTNDEDNETISSAGGTGVRGCILRADITEPSNYRNAQHLDAWLNAKNIIGISGIDTRALTAFIRQKGYVNALIAYHEDGQFDIENLKAQASAWAGLEGMDLAKTVTTGQSYQWKETRWQWNEGYNTQNAPKYKVVAIDYGAKSNILRCLASVGCEITVVPATTSAQEILDHKPDGIFLSNGPGDPAATAHYAVSVLQELMETNIPIFGICLGHQLLALASGAKTKKMHQGHHGANHPVQEIENGKVEITSMNHGFTVDETTLPEGIIPTHISLFDGSNCGIAHKNKPIFSVQHHPEASPGPQDSFYLFEKFARLMDEARA